MCTCTLCWVILLFTIKISAYPLIIMVYTSQRLSLLKYYEYSGWNNGYIHLFADSKVNIRSLGRVVHYIKNCPRIPGNAGGDIQSVHSWRYLGTVRLKVITELTHLHALRTTENLIEFICHVRLPSSTWALLSFA